MAAWTAKLLDVQGAFLNNQFQNGEQLYMHVPQGFERFYSLSVLLLLLRTIYGLKQAVMQFWRVLLAALLDMRFNQNKADPCLYFKWVGGFLILWMLWLENCMVAGPTSLVRKAKKDMMLQFECNKLGKMDKYVGCKVEHDRAARTINLTQPVLLQRYSNEFKLDEHGHTPTTPTELGTLLSKGEGIQLDKAEHSRYHTGVGKLLHMMRWMRPEIQSAVRELSLIHI
eukprot:9880112-Ditylum_brightwellii.AAC.1